MPSEDRRILFSNEEVYKALYALCAQKQIKTPPIGEIVSIRVDKVDVSRVFLTIDDKLNEKIPAVEQEYNRDFLAAALMLMCRGLGIPLPKSAKKSVLIADGKVMLRAQID